MATFKSSSEFEVKEPIESDAIIRLRKYADSGEVEAYSMKLRHPRYKTRLTNPHFYVVFRISGTVYSESAESLDALLSIIENDYLVAFKASEGVQP